MTRRVCAFALFLCVAGAVPAGGAIFTVNSAADNQTDDDACTLREAIRGVIGLVVNDDCPGAVAPGIHRIHFAIPGPGPHTISLSASLGDFNSFNVPVFVDGLTQPANGGSAASCLNGPLLIELDGSAVSTAGGQGLHFSETADGSRVRGLAINGFGTANTRAGIRLAGADNTHISCNFIGTNAAGTAGDFNRFGIFVAANSSGNVIGTNGDGVGDSAERNIISGNGGDTTFTNSRIGVAIRGTGANQNIVAGNFIGPDVTGTVVLGNDIGVHVGGPAQTDGGPDDTIIGTNGDGVGDAAERNLISGNRTGAFGGGTGVEVQGGPSPGAPTTDTRIAGNYIGLRLDGATSLPNGRGVSIRSNTLRTIVGTNGDGVSDLLERNVISGNGTTGGGGGILFSGPPGGIPPNPPIDPPTNTRIAGNYIGLAANGASSVQVRDAAGAVLVPNVFGNGTGINMGHQQAGTIIGTNGDGISDVLERNVISGNTVINVSIFTGGATATTGVRVSGNYIGTTATGTAAAANNAITGIFLQSNQLALPANNNIIGTNGDGMNDAIEGNVISGHIQNGILMQVRGPDLATIGNVRNNRIAGNFIGTNATGDAAIPNGFNGILIEGFPASCPPDAVTDPLNPPDALKEMDSNIIGWQGSFAGGNANLAERNVISGNSGRGIDTGGCLMRTRIAGNFFGTTASGNSPLPNGTQAILLRGGTYTYVLDNRIMFAPPPFIGALSFVSGAWPLNASVDTGDPVPPFVDLDSRDNCILLNTGYGADGSNGSPHVVLRNNWWGRSSGPAPGPFPCIGCVGTGEEVNGAGVDVAPHLTAPPAGSGCPSIDDPQADLNVTKTDGVASVTPGGTLTYTITVLNQGPNNVAGGTVDDVFPASLTCSWTCAADPGSSCAAGTVDGNIADTVDIENGDSLVYTASCTVAANASAPIQNTVTVAVPVGMIDPDGADNHATDIDTLTPEADLSITKDAAPTTVASGDIVTYTLVAANAGPSDVFGAAVDDTFSTSLSCTWSCAPTGTGCPAGPIPGDIHALVDIAAGSSRTYTASCTVSPAAVLGTLGNTGTIAAPAGTTDPDPNDNSDGADITIVPLANADLNVVKSGPATAVPGGPAINYTVVVTNQGPDPVTGATVTDTFPAPLTSCSWTCTPAGVGSSCSAGPVGGNIADSVNLPVNGTATYAVTCSIPASATGSIVNQASAAPPGGTADPDPSDNSSSVTTNLTPQADLAASKTNNLGSLVPGQAVTYTMTITNSGPSAAPAATVTDTFPAGLGGCSWSCSPAGGGTCNAGPVGGNVNDVVSLPLNAVLTYTANCTVSQSATGTVSNTVSVSSPTADPTPGNNQATDEDPVLGLDFGDAPASYATVLPNGPRHGIVTGFRLGALVDAEADGQPNATATGDDAAGADDEDGVGFPNPIRICSGGTTVAVTASAAGMLDAWIDFDANGVFAHPGEAVASSVPLVAGTNAITFAVPCPAVVGPTFSRFRFSGAGGLSPTGLALDGEVEDHQVTILPLADLTVTKAFSPTSIAMGGISTLTVTLSNPNSSPLTGVAVSDTYDAAVTNTATSSTTCGGTFTANTGASAFSLTGGTLPATSSCAITIDLTSSTPGSYTNTIAAGDVSSTEGPTNTTPASATLTVIPPLTVTKTFTPNVIAANGTSLLTITIANPSASPITGIDLTGTYPVGLVNTSAASTTCNGSATTGTSGPNSTLSLTGGSLGPAGGGSDTCTVTVNVSASAPGDYVNTLPAGAVTSSSGANAAPVSATLQVQGPPTVAKAFSPTSILSGNTSTLTITLSNSTPVVISNVAFTDAFPANVTATTTGSVAHCGGTQTTTANGVQLASATIPANGSCLVTATVTSSVPGTHINTIAAGDVTSDGGPNAAPAGGDLTVLNAISVTKAFSASPIGVNTNSHLTITITNGSDAPASAVAMTDTYPNGLINGSGATTTCVSGTATAAAGGSTLQLSGATLAAGASCAVEVDVTSAAAGSYDNAVEAGDVTSSLGPNIASNTATLVVIGGPTVSKSYSPSSMPLGSTSTLTIAITNPNAGNTLTDVAFSDTLAPEVVPTAPGSTAVCGGTLTVSEPPNTISLSGASIAPSGQCLIDVTVTSNVAGTYTNTLAAGEVTAAGGASNTAPASAVLSVLTAPTVASSFGPAAIPSGGTSTFAVTLSNANGVAITGAAFTNAFPVGVTIAPTPAAATTCPGGVVTPAADGLSFSSSSGSIPASGSCTVSIDVTSTTPGSHTNTIAAGTVTTANAGSNAGESQATLEVLAAPTVGKAFAPTTITSGETTDLTITLSNGNGGAITGVALTDVYPTGVTNAAAAPSTNTCGGTVTATAGAGQLQLSGGTIPANGSCIITLPVTSTAPGTHTNTIAAGDVTSANAPPSTAPAAASVTVVAPPTAAKSFGPQSIDPGSTSTLSIVITNSNPTAMTGVAFTDTYPSGFANAATPAASTSCGGTVAADPGGSSLGFTGGTIGPSAQCTIAVTVTGTEIGNHVNTIPAGGITSTSFPASTADVSGTLSIGVLDPPTVTKSFAPPSIQPGGTATLTVTLANPNASAITGVAFTDDFPSGLLVAAVPGAVSTCGGTVTAVPGAASFSFSGGVIPAAGTCQVSVSVIASASGSFANVIPAGGVTSANAAPSSGAASAALLVGISIAEIPTLSLFALLAMVGLLAGVGLALLRR